MVNNGIVPGVSALVVSRPSNTRGYRSKYTEAHRKSVTHAPSGARAPTGSRSHDW